MTEHKLPEENSNDVSGSMTPDISSDLSNTKTSQQQVIREVQRLRSKLHIPPPPESVSPSCIKIEVLLSFEKYGDGKYEVYNLCMLTSPCKHYVRNTDTDKIYLMNGLDIYDTLHKEGIHDAHFDQYAEASKNRKNPSEEDKRLLKEYEKLELEMQRERQKEKDTIKRQKELGEQYKASSRLEKLKAQNNISK